MPFVLCSDCSDFSVFPDDTHFGPAITLSVMDFKEIPGGRPSLVNLTKAELGLQFPDQGLDVSLPTIVSGGRFRVGQFKFALDCCPTRAHADFEQDQLI